MDIRKFFGGAIQNKNTNKNNSQTIKTNAKNPSCQKDQVQQHPTNKISKNRVISSDSDESIIPLSVKNKRKKIVDDTKDVKEVKKRIGKTKSKMEINLEITPNIKSNSCEKTELVLVKDDEIAKLKKTNLNAEKSRKKMKNDESLKDKKATKKSKIDEEDVVVVVEDKIEENKDKGSTMAYNSYLSREGPKALGTREIPEGQENCFEGLTFVVTGILETIERDQSKEIIEIHGGKVTQSISKKTSYVIVGREPGPAKIKKAKELKVRQLNEEGFFNLLKTLPGKESKYLVYKPQPSPTSQLKRLDESTLNSSTTSDSTKTADSSNLNEQSSQSLKKSNNLQLKDPKILDLRNGHQEIEIVKISASSKKITTPSKPTVVQLDESFETVISGHGNDDSRGTHKMTKKAICDGTKLETGSSLMWVDKYKPRKVHDILGQQGDKSSLHKLMNWLSDWFYNNDVTNVAGKGNSKKPASKFGKKTTDGDGSNFKAALMSGPPGIGKTTSAILSCKELGLTYSELNASNIRSKKCLKDLFAESLSTYNMSNYMKGIPSKFKNHVLIMDEVDGMAGNEDRGGIQELITLIKSTKLPIICICNQRSDPKMRTLVNYCYDLRFMKPRAEQIKDAMMQIMYQEKVTIEPAIVQRVIAACNNDIRQVIHSLNMISSDNKCLKYVNLANEIKDMKKDTKLDAFEITRTVFTSDSGKNGLNTKSDLFFMDYSLIPLFIQENYLNVQSFAANHNQDIQLDLICEASDFMSLADLMSQVTMKTNNWGLLPLTGICSTAAPGEIMKGYMGGMINFPKFFGKLSKSNKFQRMLKELKMHMMLRTFNDSWRIINLDYLTTLKNELSIPLTPDSLKSVATNDESNAEFINVQKVLQFMNYYYLLKEDLDNINEMSKWDTKSGIIGSRKGRHVIVDTFAQITPKLKGALTRAYGKSSFKIPYVLERASEYGMVRKSSRPGVLKTYGEGEGDGVEGDSNDEVYVEDNQDDEKNKDDPDFLTNDKMIKQKKSSNKTKPQKVTKSKKK